jgi:hypothetical protein
MIVMRISPIALHPCVVARYDTVCYDVVIGLYPLFGRPLIRATKSSTSVVIVVASRLRRPAEWWASMPTLRLRVIGICIICIPYLAVCRITLSQFCKTVSRHAAARMTPHRATAATHHRLRIPNSPAIINRIVVVQMRFSAILCMYCSFLRRTACFRVPATSNCKNGS